MIVLIVPQSSYFKTLLVTDFVLLKSYSETNFLVHLLEIKYRWN